MCTVRGGEWLNGCEGQLARLFQAQDSCDESLGVSTQKNRL